MEDMAESKPQKNSDSGNSRYLRASRGPAGLPPIDIADPAQVARRVDEYLDHCESTEEVPTVHALARWLGVHRDTLNSWTRGEYRTATHSDLLKNFRDIMEDFYSRKLIESKQIPTNLIFLLKNWFGWKDVQDIVVAPNNFLDTVPVEELEKRIPPDIPIDVDWTEE